ncbi:uncharacterized protein LOC120350117 [Nilaparvata lugens]|nr:uncharacterized protein LOC120350117 [Nilaparvata lugens]
MVSRRHLSTDSTRDSGIGDGSNSNSSLSAAAERHMSLDSQHSQHLSTPINVASRLPENSYFYIRPNRYIFHGAEMMVDDPRELLPPADDRCDTTTAAHQLTIDRQQLKQYLSVVAHDSKMWGSNAAAATSPDEDLCLVNSSSSSAVEAGSSTSHNLSSTT